MHFYGWKLGLKTGQYYLRSKAAVEAIKFTVDPAELAKYVLSYGFGVKNPEKFMAQQAPPAGPEGAATSPEGAAPPPSIAGGMGGPPAAGAGGGAFEATGGVPPELLSQLQGQMGVELPNL